MSWLNPTAKKILWGIVRPLASRKVRVALVTVLAAYAAQHGLAIGEELMLVIVSVGVAVILGIAHEDNGRNAAEGQSGGLSVGGQIDLQAVLGELMKKLGGETSDPTDGTPPAKS